MRPPSSSSSSSLVECAFPFISPVKHDDMPNKLDNRQNRSQVKTVNIGPCKWVFDEKCPNSDIKFYLYTRKNAQDRQLIHVDETWEKSNLSDSNFNPNEPTKIILHGYNSDMFLTPLIQMKRGMFMFVSTIDLFDRQQKQQQKTDPHSFWTLNFETFLLNASNEYSFERCNLCAFAKYGHFNRCWWHRKSTTRVLMTGLRVFLFKIAFYLETFTLLQNISTEVITICSLSIGLS